jgi:phosphoribosylanthranilate isomerase
VLEVIRRWHPYGVDVASGVESIPGRKDAGRMQAFCWAVRRATQLV